MNESKRAVDQAVVDADMIDNNNTASWRERLLCADHWLRIAFMLLFAIILSAASYIMTLLVLLQCLFAMLTGTGKEALRQLGSSLSTYIYQILQFMTYNTEDKPFPFDDWPK